MHIFESMKNKMQVILRRKTTFTDYGEQILKLSKKRLSKDIPQGKPTEPQYKVIIPYMFKTIKDQQEQIEHLSNALLTMAELSKQMAIVLVDVKGDVTSR